MSGVVCREKSPREMLAQWPAVVAGGVAQVSEKMSTTAEASAHMVSCAGKCSVVCVCRCGRKAQRAQRCAMVCRCEVVVW